MSLAKHQTKFSFTTNKLSKISFDVFILGEKYDICERSKTKREASFQVPRFREGVLWFCLGGVGDEKASEPVMDDGSEGETRPVCHQHASTQFISLSCRNSTSHFRESGEVESQAMAGSQSRRRKATRGGVGSGLHKRFLSVAAKSDLSGVPQQAVVKLALHSYQRELQNL